MKVHVMFVLLFVTTVVGHSPNLCNLQVDTGDCRAIIPMYYYNIQSRRCEQFPYGGCGGNANRFHTRRQCQLRCSYYTSG
ncbi:hypothetical protein ScPMuIL_009232 [Solemya velum]